MKKVLSNSKLSTPSKFVRRVLSRSSNVSTSQEQSNPHQVSTSESTRSKPDRTTLQLELTSLREQLSILQVAVNNMQEDADKREQALASLAREKQQLSTDLKREKRSSTSLKQQLEDERQFYYKEKEQYCQEMNDCKKLKKKISDSIVNKKSITISEDSTELTECKSQISKLKTALNQTLEANYNLSVKFLRMKNTKISLRNRLKRQQSDHEQAMRDLQVKINNIKNDIADVVDKRFTLPISPSNKKYLQIIKQNGILMHENLCLQMEVDQLNWELELLKSKQLCQESREKLNHAKNCPPHKMEVKPSTSKQIPSKLDVEAKSKKKVKSTKQVRTVEPPKSNIEQQPTRAQEGSKQNSPKNDTKVIKIFERRELEGIPEIIMLTPNNEQMVNEAKMLTDKTDLQSVSTKGSSNFGPVSSTQMSTETSEFTQTTESREAIRTQSAPEIVQTSLFVSNNKP